MDAISSTLHVAVLPKRVGTRTRLKQILDRARPLHTKVSFDLDRVREGEREKKNLAMAVWLRALQSQGGMRTRSNFLIRNQGKGMEYNVSLVRSVSFPFVVVIFLSFPELHVCSLINGIVFGSLDPAFVSFSLISIHFPKDITIIPCRFYTRLIHFRIITHSSRCLYPKDIYITIYLFFSLSSQHPNSTLHFPFSLQASSCMQVIANSFHSGV